MPSDRKPQRRNSMLKVALQLILFVVFVLMIVYFMDTFSADLSSLRLLSALDILLIGSWSFVSYTAYAYAVYAMLLGAGLRNLQPFAWLRIYFASRLVNLFIIQGGNLFRLFVLKKKYQFSYANSIGITALLLWLNASIALLAAGYFLVTTAPYTVKFGDSILALPLVVLVFVLILPLLVVWVMNKFRDSSILPTKVLEPLLKIADYFAVTTRNPRLMMQITALSGIHFAFFVGVNYFCFQALGQDVGVVGACFFTTAFVFTRYINIVPGNLGLSELVGGLVSEFIGVGFGNGLLVAGILRVIEVFTIAVFGLVYGKFLIVDYLRNRRGADSLRT